MERTMQDRGSSLHQSRKQPSAHEKRGKSLASENMPSTSDSPPCHSILRLPDDVLYIIFQYLNPTALCRLSQVCERFRQLASEDCVWLAHERNRTVPRSNKSRCLGAVKERYRTSFNWESGHRSEFWLLRYSNRLLPWLQKEENILWVSRGNLILKFDVKDNGRLRKCVGGHLQVVRADVTRFVINNGIVVSGYRGGGVSTWEASSGIQLLNCKDAHESDTECVDVIDDVIVSGSKDKTVKVLSMFPEDTVRVKKCFNIEDRVWSLCASPNRTTVAVGTACYNHQAIVLLDISSGQVLGQLGDNHHKRGAGVLDMKFESPNTLLTCGHDTYLRMWDLRMQACVNMWEDGYDSAVYCLQSDGQNTMLTGTARHGLVRLWDKRQTHHVQVYYCGEKNSPVYSLAANSHYMYRALDLGLNLVDFSIR